MELSDINICIVKCVVDELDSHFYTRDVSEHNLMTQVHSSFVHEWAYHSVVGRVIGANVAYLNIKYVNKGNDRGALWRKN
jgi:hypothetical protein